MTTQTVENSSRSGSGQTTTWSFKKGSLLKALNSEYGKVAPGGEQLLLGESQWFYLRYFYLLFWNIYNFSVLLDGISIN